MFPSSYCPRLLVRSNSLNFFRRCFYSFLYSYPSDFPPLVPTIPIFSPYPIHLSPPLLIFYCDSFVTCVSKVCFFFFLFFFLNVRILFYFFFHFPDSCFVALLLLNIGTLIIIVLIYLLIQQICFRACHLLPEGTSLVPIFFYLVEKTKVFKNPKTLTVLIFR